MAKCKICEAETELHVAGKPLCLACDKKLQVDPNHSYSLLGARAYVVYHPPEPETNSTPPEMNSSPPK
jgi:hypothetical protein